MKRLAIAHGSHVMPESGVSSSLTTTAEAAAATVMIADRVNDSRCAVVSNVIITTRKNAPSNAPSRLTVIVTGTMTSTAKTSAGSRGTRPRSDEGEHGRCDQDEVDGIARDRSAGR